MVDAGVNVRKDEEILNQAMEKAAKRLNLKPHLVGFTADSCHVLHAAGDLEGHLGEDGRYYLVDFGTNFTNVVDLVNLKSFKN